MISRMGLAAIGLLLILGNAYAQSVSDNSASPVYTLTWHLIEVIVDEQGYASINERFHLDFTTPEKLDSFRQKHKSLGVDLLAWKEFDARFRTHIGKESEIVPGSAVLAFVEEDIPYLELSYELTEPLFKQVSESSRAKEFELKTISFTSFLVKPFYVFPDSTVIQFNLPALTTINKNKLAPSGDVFESAEKTILVWTGPKTSNELTIQYTYWKQIAPPLSIALVVKEFLENTKYEMMALLGLIFALLIAFAYVRRKKFEKQITEYIVKHSEL